MKQTLTLIFILAFSLPLIAQKTDSSSVKHSGPNFFLRGDFESGSVIPSADLPDFVTNVIGGNIEAGWQATGSNKYDPLLAYPSFGFGFLTYSFPQTDSLGRPNAFYMFLNSPMKRWKKFSLNYIIRLGMSYNWEPSDPVANPFHAALGSYRNLYISAGLEGQYFIGESLSASLGVKFAHFSNGQSSLPNAGMNLLTPHLGLKYDFNGGSRPAYTKYPKPEYTEKGMEYYVTLGTGIRQIFFSPKDSIIATRIPRQGESYPVYNISMAAQYQFGWVGKVGGGLDLIYWGAYNPAIEIGPGNVIQPVKYPFSDYLQLGIFISYEFVLNNVSIIAQPGYRIIRKDYKDLPTDFYQHLGLKYHVHNLIIGVAIRAVNFGQAEYIEWSLGYRFRKAKK